MTVSGHDTSSGVNLLRLVAVNADGRVVVGQIETCGAADRDPADGSCPHRVTRSLTVDPAGLPDGKSTFEVEAVDLARNTSRPDQSWDTYIDHTPPSAPTGLVVTARSVDTATVNWNRITDSPSGSPAVSYQYLVKAGDRTVVNWTTTPYPSAVVPGLPAGVDLTVLVRSLDVSGNLSHDTQGATRLARAAKGGPGAHRYDLRDCAGHSPCGSFDAGAAVRYAMKYRASFNPDFPKFKGDDCTNFMSQIMRAGGMQLMREYDPGKGSWWAQPPLGNSVSWSVADDFYRHLIRYHLAEHVNGPYRPGDLIAWNWHADEDKHVDHFNFVVSVDAEGVPYLVQHSNEYPTPKSMGEFVAIARSQGLKPIGHYHLRPVHTAANIS